MEACTQVATQSWFDGPLGFGVTMLGVAWLVGAIGVGVFTGHEHGEVDWTEALFWPIWVVLRAIVGVHRKVFNIVFRGG